MGGRRKKKRQGPQADTHNEEAAEELEALEAIYGEDLAVDEDRHGFALRVLPHPAELQDNLVSTVLVIRSVYSRIRHFLILECPLESCARLCVWQRWWLQRHIACHW